MTALFKEKEEKIKEDRVNAAFIGWQFYSILNSTGLLGQGKLIKYPEYLENLGLLDPKEIAGLQLYRTFMKEQNKHEAKKNVQEANKIVEMLRTQREEGKQNGSS